MLIFFLIFLIQLEVGTSISYSQKPLTKKKKKPTHFQIEKIINQGFKWFILKVKQLSGIGDNW